MSNEEAKMTDQQHADEIEKHLEAAGAAIYQAEQDGLRVSVDEKHMVRRWWVAIVSREEHDIIIHSTTLKKYIARQKARSS